ncbi:hypothetical protein SMC3_01050 [Candidatus Cryosericum hinesii]|jgi:hypothetical protein|uniref:Yip1 domain-containing protein n=1 Tax=Candidatus Cryosericum hinesii TaxID=2290915 RepID=A0A398DLS7_9BACT|nr:hypothetical protein [Candidatus Cryosericum hinesii]RIE10940.1 hypothetical protein SMC4_00855 [Candidatus Cryosericum hinesii]RIE14819.1 hypothetical protein SMC3_01050 [Candidatus Cryosericum hinesii]RIE15340.1 hypothetical protein SMC2_01430 [Candidatus Cryosericum hinesii]
MFGIIPGLITARLTGLLGGVVVAPFVMLFMVRYDAYRLPVRLSWFKAFLVSTISFLLLFGPLILPRTTALLRFSFVRDTLFQELPWAVLWFVAAFVVACLVVSAMLGLSFRQAVSWWGIAFAATLVVSWIGALAIVLLYRYLILPSLTDFF